jgi:hypothetical protein
LSVPRREAQLKSFQASDPIYLLTRCEAAATDLGLSRDAVVLVRLVLENLARELGPDAGSDQVTAAMLCEGLLRCDTTLDDSAEQLRRTGIESSETVGRIVEWLVRDRLIRPRKNESQSDYRGLFDLRAYRDV